MPKNKNPRANGEGSIRQRPDGRWEARYTAGVNPSTGKQITRSIYGKTQSEVRTKLRDTLTKIEKGTYVEPSGITVEEWVSSCIDTLSKQGQIRPSTHENYSVLARTHIFPTLGRVKLSKLTARDVQKFYNALVDKPVTIVAGKTKIAHEKRTLSARTVRVVHAILHRSMDVAVKQNILPLNPTAACILPEQEHKEMKTLPLNTAGLDKFFKTLAADVPEGETMGRHYALFILELATGLRRGEILGLRWCDVDLQAGTLVVAQQLTRTKGALAFSRPKTKLSRRMVKIPDSALGVLTSHYRRQCAMRLRAGSAWQDNDLVFCNELGGPYDPSAIYHYLLRVLEKAGLPRIRFHDLRHTYATMALENGADTKSISAALGHYSTSFTMDTYGHVTEKLQEDSANKVDSVLKRHIIS